MQLCEDTAGVELLDMKEMMVMMAMVTVMRVKETHLLDET